MKPQYFKQIVKYYGVRIKRVWEELSSSLEYIGDTLSSDIPNFYWRTRAFHQKLHAVHRRPQISMEVSDISSMIMISYQTRTKVFLSCQCRINIISVEWKEKYRKTRLSGRLAPSFYFNCKHFLFVKQNKTKKYFFFKPWIFKI